MENDVDLLKKQLKYNIQQLIDAGNLEEAKQLIEQYKNIDKDDVEAYSMDAVILIMEEKLDEAEDVVKDGLNLDQNNFDLNYNLGYLYEKKENFKQALWYYDAALHNCNDGNLASDIDNLIKNIQKEYNIKTIESKNKMAFFVRNGLDSFLEDIIKGLSEDYETKKIIVTDYKQIDKGMQWADICWFEWCDELVIYGSKLPIAKEKKIVCRLHGYEVFTDMPNRVSWKTVDRLIFVANHKKNIFFNRFGNIINNNKICLLRNGINIKKYTIPKNKIKNKNIAFVGNINYRKGFEILIQFFYELLKKDPKYKLYIRGEYQDLRYKIAIETMVEELKIQNNIIFVNRVDNLNEWFCNMTYIVSSSIEESFHYTIGEGMLAGLKPVVHAWKESRDIWPSKYIFRDKNEFLDIILSKDYNPKEYRQFVVGNYRLEKQVVEIRNILNNISDSSKISDNIVEFDYNGEDIKFYLPYLNDWIQKVIYSTENFYEIQMLKDIKNRIGKNKTIVDIGANIGNHTIFFSKVCKAKKVYSFEPQKNIFKILNVNVKLNNCDRIVNLYNIGLGKQPGHANVNVVDKNNYGSTSLEKSEKGNVEINTLDNVIYSENEKIDMIKIDVEGMELEVMGGAINILTKYKPLIYVEAASEIELKNVTTFLKRFGYKPISRFNATPTYLFI